jgi:hypothetical protein
MCARLICGTPATATDLCVILDRMAIDVLPDVVLLEMFDYYVNQVREEDSPDVTVESWRTLVHVCRNWRSVVFGSPRRLNLRLLCTPETPVRKALAIWPCLPIFVQQRQYGSLGGDSDNIVAALEHNDRVCEIDLFDISSSHLEKALAAMQEPFPALTRLEICRKDDGTPPVVVPDSFMGGGSAPRLRYLDLTRVPFPGLPRLLSSAATQLVHLYLWKTPQSGYISPEAIVPCLSALTSLESLSLEFESPRSRPNQQRRRLPPPTRSVLPSLTCFIFKGVSVYLEDLVARFDAPLLDNLQVTFFHQLIFDSPQLVQLISRTPNLKAPVEARVIFSSGFVQVTLTRPGETSPRGFGLGFTCGHSDWQLSSLAQVFSSSIPQALISTVEQLYIYESGFLQPRWQDDIEDSQWLDVLNPFTAVKDLYLSKNFVPRIAPTLQELVGERVSEVLPALQCLFLDKLHPSGTVQEEIVKFVAARQLAEHPIVVSLWEREQNDGPGSEADDSSVTDGSLVVDGSSVMEDSSVVDD